MLRIIREIIKDFTSYFWPTKRAGLLRLVALLLAIFVLSKFLGGTGTEQVEEQNTLKTVKVASVSTLSGASSLELIGSVESASQAEIEAEVSGRVTNVTVELGDQVAAGQTIATLENQSEFAAVLQAEGAYEAALAAAAQSDVSVEEARTRVTSAQNDLLVAQNNIVTTYRNAYTSANSIVLSDIDDFFSDPFGPNTGLRISGKGETQNLNNQREALVDSLAAWQKSANAATTNSDLLALLDDAETQTLSVRTMVDIFLRIIPDTDPTATFPQTTLDTAVATFNADRNTLDSTLTAIESARTTLVAAEQALVSAEEALERAQIGGTESPELSAANAQVKQALGSLRSAQANLAKTILRSPISGTVNELDVKTGDFLGAFTQAALVANNDALEITTFVGERDREALSIGDTVLIENEFEGTITNIAPAVDTQTKKVEVKIATESTELQNGDSVRISITQEDTAVVETVIIPLSAVKFTVEDGSVFTLDGTTLISNPVTLGDIRGGNIVITEGLSLQDEIVVDARGLSSGQQVEGTR